MSSLLKRKAEDDELTANKKNTGYSVWYMNKIKGMLYAIAIGDALGIPFEFKNSTPKLTYDPVLPDVDINIRFNQFHSVTMKSCSPSDDTEMTLALLFSLIANRMKYVLSDTLLNYMKWANLCSMLGKNTSKLLKGVTTIKGYTNRVEKMTKEKRATQSNGSLMRASPLALMKDFSEDDIKLDVDITNPNSVNFACDCCFVRMLRCLLAGGSKEDCKSICREFSAAGSGTPMEIRKCISDSFDKECKRDISYKTNVKGWVGSSFYIALRAFWNFDTFSDAMRFVIESHPGSDTDTNASITSALFGAWLGFDALAQCSITKVNIEKMDRYWSTSASIYKLTPDLFARLQSVL